MHLILTGATGLVGSSVLHQMLINPSVSRVSILSRRPVPFAENKEKVKVYIHKDFSTYPASLLTELKGAKGCVWALGVSQRDVNAKKYEDVTLAYPLAAAKAFSELSDSFNFVYVSGEGATLTPGLTTPTFGRVKGQAEKALLQLSSENESLKPYSVRPAAVDPSSHPEIQPYLPTLSLLRRVTGQLMFPLTRLVWTSYHSPSGELGRVLVELAMGDGRPLQGRGISGEGRTVENVGMRRLAGI